MKDQLSKKDIRRLFSLLNDDLADHDERGEIYMVGGAVMCLVMDARAATRDVDALFKPAKQIREAARRVAIEANVNEDWLNDGVKGFLSENAAFEPYLELSHLTVLTAQPDYLLAMKCLAFRIGAEFHDQNDIRFLLRNLNISNYNEALTTIGRYYPLDRFPQKTLYALEELCEPTD